MKNKKTLINSLIILGFVVICVVLYILAVRDIPETQQNSDAGTGKIINDNDDLNEFLAADDNDEKSQSAAVTDDNKTEISSTEEFISFARSVSEEEKDYSGEYVYLSSDIDLTDADFQPIGSGESGNITVFKGIFDGQGHSIIGMNLNGDGPQGLFAELDGYIFNLTIAACDIKCADTGGGFAAILDGNGAIINSLSCARVYSPRETAVCGGLAGIAKGEITNCAMMHPKGDGGSETLVGKEDGAVIIHSYTANSSKLKLTCDGSEANNYELRSRGAANLNDELASLCMEYPDIDFHKWNLIDEYPLIAIETRKNDMVKKITIQREGSDTAAAYDMEHHLWVPEDTTLSNLGSSTVVCTTSLGNEYRFDVAENFEEVEFDYDGVTYHLGVCPIDIADIPYPEDEVTIDFNVIETSCPEQAKCITTGYYDENKQLTTQEKKVYIASKGVYRLTGSFKGYIYTDVSDYGTEGLTLIFDDLHIESEKMPAIFVSNALKDAKNPGVNVILADGSDNFLKGSYFVDIYSRKNKADGVLSARCNLALYGDTGKLTIEGTQENIEVGGELSFNGGNYVLHSQDDCISGTTALRINDGTFEMQGGDNCGDYDNIFVNGGLITGNCGGPLEGFLRQGLRINGGTIAYTGKVLSPLKESRQGYITLDWDEAIEQKLQEDGTYLLIIDEDDKPVLAIHPAEGFLTGGFTVPDIYSKTFRIYLANNIEGSLTYNVCTDITDYNVITQLKAGDAYEFDCKNLNDKYTLVMEGE